jgi:hypothetical protein
LNPKTQTKFHSTIPNQLFQNYRNTILESKDPNKIPQHNSKPIISKLPKNPKLETKSIEKKPHAGRRKC